jgi:hypothetical protein
VRRRALAAAGAGLMVLAIAGVAGGAGLKKKAVDFPVPGDTEAQETAKCKRGQEAVAGGFFLDAITSSTVLPTFESQRAGTRRWTYRLYSGVDTEASVYAYCDKSEPGLKVKTATETLNAGGAPTSIVARCGPGKEAVSGGFDGPFTEFATVASKRSGKRSWEAVFVGPQLEATTVVYCDKNEPGLKSKQAATTVTEDVPESVSAKCKRKQELRSGGFEIEFVSTPENEGLVTGSRREGKRRWQVSGFGIDGEPEMVAYAYCDKKQKKG